MCGHAVFLGLLLWSYLFQGVRLGFVGAIDLVHLTLFHGRKQQVRTLGSTIFAHPASYDNVRLSEQNRLEYFRDGVTVVRGALRPQLVEALRETLVADFGTRNTIWNHFRAPDSDALMDFYLYGNFGSLVADILRSPNTETTGQEESIHLWRDFMYFRWPGYQLTGFHVDAEDCDRDGLPANYTLGNRPRVWTPLNDMTTGPVFFNQSRVLEEVTDEAILQTFWAGQLTTSIIQHVPQENLRNMVIGTGRLRLGDVVLHVPCMLHSSPPQKPNDVLAAVLFPTYASAQSDTQSKLYYTRSCELRGSGTKVRDNPECFLAAYPPEARHRRGTQINFKHRGSLSEWFRCTLSNTGMSGISPLHCFL